MSRQSQLYTSLTTTTRLAAAAIMNAFAFGFDLHDINYQQILPTTDFPHPASQTDFTDSATVFFGYILLIDFYLSYTNSITSQQLQLSAQCDA